VPLPVATCPAQKPEAALQAAKFINTKNGRWNSSVELMLPAMLPSQYCTPLTNQRMN
jgi:hypothetical protein